MINLKLNNVYGNLKLFDNQELKIERNQKVLIVGYTLTGKTAILEQICEKCARFSQISEDDAKIITSYLPSQPVFFENKTALFNLNYAAKVANVKINDEVYGFLKNCNLIDKLNEKVDNFNYFEKQLLALARAKIKNPELILIDDWFHDCDENSSKLTGAINQVLNEKDKTVVVTSRGLVDKNWKFDKIYLIDNAKLLEFNDYVALKKFDKEIIKIMS